MVKFDPGVAPRNHRTDSIDYGVIIYGELDMHLDDGVFVHLKAGDCIVLEESSRTRSPLTMTLSSRTPRPSAK